MRFNQLLLILFCFSIFSKGLFLNRELTGYDLDLFAYPLYIFLFFTLIFKQRFDFFFIIRFFFILIILFTPYFFNNYSYDGYLKICLPLLIVFPSIYSYLKDTGLHNFFNSYVRVSKWVAVIGILQFLLKLNDISIFSKYSRVDLHSIVTEPSHYVVVIIPACVYTFLNYKSYKTEFLLFIITLILTLKTTAFISLFLIFLIIKRKLKNLILIAPIFYIILIQLLNYEQYSFRILSVYQYFFQDEIDYNLHGTPLSFLTNLEVATYSANNNLFGSGIGSHKQSYDIFFRSNPWDGPDYQLGLNKNSAHSLLIRILSELGYIGLLIFIYFFFYAFNKLKYDKMKLSMFFAAFSHFISKSLKLGGYIDYGTPIFFAVILILLSHHDTKRVNTL